MTNSPYSFLFKIIMKGITFSFAHQHREQMIYILGIIQMVRKGYERILDAFIIHLCHFLSVSVILHQILQFHI